MFIPQPHTPTQAARIPSLLIMDKPKLLSLYLASHGQRYATAFTPRYSGISSISCWSTGNSSFRQGSAKHSWISREDCARAATGALIGKLTTTGPVDVTGPEALGFADLASRLSSLSDHQITALTLPDQEIIALVTAKGVPADVARSTMRLISWIAHGLTETPTDTVERASGTKPTSIDTILRTLVSD